MLPECGFSNSSASIFSKNFLTELSKVHNVDVIGFKLPSNYAKGLTREGVDISRWIELDSKRVFRSAPKKNTNISTRSESKSKKIVDLVKSVVPDFYTLGMLDIKSLSTLTFDNDYDYIVSMSDPKSAHFLSIYLKARVKELRNVKVVQMWGDPWYFDITKKTNFITKLVEGFILTKANFVFYRSIATVKQQKKHFSFAKSRMSMIDRGFIGNELSETDFKIKKETYNFLYLGDYNPAVRDIGRFCEIANSYGHRVKLIGSAPDRFKQKLKYLESTIQLDRLSPSELQPYIEASDCLVIVLNKRGTQIPGKVYDLLAVEKPVVLLLDGEITVEDIPAHSRFKIIKNDNEALTSFFEGLDSLECSIRKELNDFHMKNVIKSFINHLVVF